MKSCPYCHAAIPDAAEICPCCGERQPISRTRNTQGSRQTNPSGQRGAREAQTSRGGSRSQTRAKRNSTRTLWIAVAVVAVLLVACLCAALFLLRDTGSKESGDSLPVQSEESETGALSQDGTETSGDPEAQTVYETKKLLTRVTCTNEDGEEVDAYRYFYDENGQMTKYYDLGAMRNTLDYMVYDYDENGRRSDVRYYREDPYWDEDEDEDGSGRYYLSDCYVYEYDEEGRLTSIAIQDAGGTVSQVTEYTYGTDPKTSMISLSAITTERGEVIRRATNTPVYDEATDTICLESEMVNYWNGEVMYSSNSRDIYDSNLRLISYCSGDTDQDGSCVNLEYDADGNLTRVTHTNSEGNLDGESVFTFERDADGTILSMTWDCMDSGARANQTPGIGGLVIGSGYSIHAGDTLLYTYYYDEVQVPVG